MTKKIMITKSRVVIIILLVVLFILVIGNPFSYFSFLDEKNDIALQRESIFDNVNHLKDEYDYKIKLVNEIQIRTDNTPFLVKLVSSGLYEEWIRRNNEAIIAGDNLEMYIRQNRNILTKYGEDKNWVTDILVTITRNKEIFKHDNEKLAS